jgi:hypothetical protein
LWLEQSKSPYGKITQKCTPKYKSYKLHKNDQASNQQASPLPSFKKACTFCTWTCCSDWQALSIQTKCLKIFNKLETFDLVSPIPWQLKQFSKN